MLVTGHRRENFGAGLDGLCAALRALADRYADLVVVYPVHLNPAVEGPVRAALGNHPRVRLTPPLDYLGFAALLRRAYLAITDSGGVQEEAPSFGVPVLVTRAARAAKPSTPAAPASSAPTATPSSAPPHGCSTTPRRTPPCAPCSNPFGDGHAAERIVAHLENALKHEKH
ncbi:MAG: UDP-N-acetylglucosamine 2-epimerase [Candidatus Binatia bacterium]